MSKSIVGTCNVGHMSVGHSIIHVYLPFGDPSLVKREGATEEEEEERHLILHYTLASGETVRESVVINKVGGELPHHIYERYYRSSYARLLQTIASLEKGHDVSRILERVKLWFHRSSALYKTLITREIEKYQNGLFTVSDRHHALSAHSSELNTGKS